MGEDSPDGSLSCGLGVGPDKGTVDVLLWPGAQCCPIVCGWEAGKGKQWQGHGAPGDWRMEHSLQGNLDFIIKRQVIGLCVL